MNGMRLDLVDVVNHLSSDRENDRAENSFAQHANERERLSLRDNLVEAYPYISWCRGEKSEIQTQAESQHREHKYMLEMLECKGILHRKRPHTGSTAGGDLRT